MIIKHILVPSDFSASAGKALNTAFSIAQKHDAKITLLHIVTLYNDDPYHAEPPLPDLGKYYEKLEQKADRLFKDALLKHADQDVNFEYVVRRGFSPFEEILSFASENNVDLITLGTHSRKPVARFFLGSVALNIVHHAECPVLTTRLEKNGRNFPEFRRIVVATDFYEQSERALQFALSLLESHGVIDLLHVVEDVIHPAYFAADGESIFDVMPHIKTKSTATLEQMAADFIPEKIDRNIVIREGRVATKIIEHAEESNADLIVMGTHSMNAVTQLLVGSQANKVIRKATCPVITIK